MKIQKITSHMLSKEPDQTSYILNKVIDKVNNGTGGGGTVDIRQTTGTSTTAVMSQAATTIALSTKVNSVPGKGLSSNDYTTDEKHKLSGIEEGAERNLPNTVSDANYVHTDNNYTTTDKNKVASIASDITAGVNAGIAAHNTSTTAHPDIRNDIQGIEQVIPNQASSTNQLADKNFVNSSINSVVAYYITKNAEGEQFSSIAELESTTVFYSGGEVRVPTRNDYCIVLEDETRPDPVTGEHPTSRYIYQNGWEFQYVVNKTSLTADQLAAINSGITDTGVNKLNGIEAGAQVNVKPDWNSDSSADSGILNKPTIGDATITLTQGGVTKGSFTTNQTGDTTIDLDQGGSDAVWGNITGTLSEQADLQTELDKKIESEEFSIVPTVTPIVSTDNIQDNAITPEKIQLISLFNLIYPVGSIYMSSTLSTASQVSELLGGTWEAWGAGRVPVGVDANQTEFDTVEKTGGIKNTAHVSYAPPNNSNNFQDAGTNYVNSAESDMNTYLTANGSSSLSRNSIVRNVGGAIGSNGTTATEVRYYKYTAPNLQPYITCYMYRRIS